MFWGSAKAKHITASNAKTTANKNRGLGDITGVVEGGGGEGVV